MKKIITSFLTDFENVCLNERNGFKKNEWSLKNHHTDPKKEMKTRKKNIL